MARFIARPILILSLAAGLVALSSGCNKKIQTSPNAPPPPTPTATFSCACRQVILPGSLQTLPLIRYPVYPVTRPIATATPGGPTDTPTPSPTPTVTATPELDPSLTTRGVIRSAADWVSYCALAGIDPTTNPAPTDFSRSMIIYQWMEDPGSGCGIHTTATFGGLDCRSDMLVMNDTYLTRFVICLYPLSMPIAANPGSFHGYIVDQSPLPVFWQDAYGTNSITSTSLTSTCPGCRGVAP